MNGLHAKILRPKFLGEEMYWFNSRPIRCGMGQGYLEIGSFHQSCITSETAERSSF